MLCVAASILSHHLWTGQWSSMDGSLQHYLINAAICCNLANSFYLTVIIILQIQLCQSAELLALVRPLASRPVMPKMQRFTAVTLRPERRLWLLLRRPWGRQTEEDGEEEEQEADDLSKRRKGKLCISEAGFMTAAHSRPFVGRRMRKRLKWCLAGDTQSGPAGCWLRCVLAMTLTSYKRKYPHLGRLTFVYHQSLLSRTYFVIKCHFVESPPWTKTQYILLLHCFIDFEVSVGGAISVSAFSLMNFSL